MTTFNEIDTTSFFDDSMEEQDFGFYDPIDMHELGDFGNDEHAKAVEAILAKNKEKFAKEAFSKQKGYANSVLRIIFAARLITLFGTDTDIGNEFLAATQERISFWGDKKPSGYCYGNVVYKFAKETTSHKTFTAFKTALAFIQSLPKVSSSATAVMALNSRSVSASFKKTDNFIIDGKEVGLGKFNCVINGSILKPGLVHAVDSINIHEEYEEMVESNGYTDEQYAKKMLHLVPMHFDNAFDKLMFIISKGLNFDKLYKDSRYTMVLKFTMKGELLPVVCPGYSLPDVYENTGLVGLAASKDGIVTTKNDFPMVLEYHTRQIGNRIVNTVTSREEVNKTLSRVEKLELKTDGWTIKVPFLVLASMPNKHKHWFSTGPAMMSGKWLRKHGVCRLTSTMNNGGIKAATSYIRFIDTDLDDAGINVISASSFKGGLLAAYMLKMGDRNKLHDLSRLIGEQSDALRQLATKFLPSLETYMVGGQEVLGLMIEVDVRISNAYTAESIQLSVDKGEAVSELQALLEKADKEADKFNDDIAVNGFRDSLMDSIINGNAEMGTRITNALETGEVKWKSNVTRIIASQFQSVAYWHGWKEANQWLRGLTRNGLNKYDVTRRQAVEYRFGLMLKDDSLIVAKKAAYAVVTNFIEEMKLHGLNPVVSSSTFPRSVIEQLHSDFGGDKESGWVKLMYGSTPAYIPVGRLLFKDLLDSDESQIRVTGLLHELITNLQNLLDDKGYIIRAEENNLRLTRSITALVQAKLLGKEFGRQYTYGMYGVILPLPTLPSRSVACMTGRDRFTKPEEKYNEYTKANIGKHPMLMDQACASMDITKDAFPIELDDEMKAIFNCVIFMHPEAILGQQNDADGDIACATFDDHILPYYGSNGGVTGRFNARFHTDFITDETEGNKMKIKPAMVSTMKDFQKAMFDAVEAKDLVAKFTANKFFYEYALSYVDNFVGVDGNSYTVSHVEKRDMIILAGELVQTEAMDNIKQSGSDSYVMDTIMYYDFRNLNTDTRYMTAEERVLRAANKAIVQLKKYVSRVDDAGVKLYNIANPEAWATKVVMSFVHCALNVDDHMFAMYSDRKMHANIMTAMDEDYEGTYNFFNCSDLNPAPKHESMYHRILRMTLHAYNKVNADAAKL